MVPGWKATLDVSDVFNNDGMAEQERMVEVAHRFGRFLAKHDVNDSYTDDLSEELTDAAESGHVDWFDQVWGAVYDWADEERIWIKTF